MLVKNQLYRKNPILSTKLFLAITNLFYIFVAKNKHRCFYANNW